MILFLVVVMFCLLAKNREAHVCLWLCVCLSPLRLKSPPATEPKRKLQSSPVQTDTTDHYSHAQATGPAAAAGPPHPIFPPCALPTREISLGGRPQTAMDGETRAAPGKA